MRIVYTVVGWLCFIAALSPDVPWVPVVGSVAIKAAWGTVGVFALLHAWEKR